MARRWKIVLAVACVIVLGGAGFLVTRIAGSDDDPSSAERNACYSFRDLADALDDQSITNVEGITPDVRAVNRHANRSDNAQFTRQAARLRTTWGAYAEAVENDFVDSAEDRRWNRFVDAYSDVVNTCDGLGVEIG